MDSGIFNNLLSLINNFPIWLIWFIVAIIFFIVEAATVSLCTIWFGFGALLALLASLLGWGMGTQIIIFFLVSSVSLAFFLLFFRPKIKGARRQPDRTNADRIIDEIGVVVKEINPMLGAGQILVQKQYWTASTADQSSVPVGAKVKVLRIEGVKAIVETLPEAAAE
ncbi:MAG: NfeD family protein [Eubacteriales bacterium]|nr:NfeD family protein [Eubacteriales bacterium]